MFNSIHFLPKSVRNGGSSYFALFRLLQDVQSRCILTCGIVLSIAAGAPLPIIGIIFSRIINTFPPSEEEIRLRVCELIGVGMYFHTCLQLHRAKTQTACAYFAITWGWTVCWGIVGARISQGLRTQMFDRALALDQTYYETQCPDVCYSLRYSF